MLTQKHDLAKNLRDRNPEILNSSYMNWFEVVFLSLIEGITEFLPVSSTGHLILTSAMFGIQDEGFVKAFNIIIQFGAILAVVYLYWKRFLPNMTFYKKIFVAFLPAAVIGLAVKSKIDLILGSVYVVAVSLILGGIILVWTDRKFETLSASGKKTDDLSLVDCLKLGFIQCLAFIPGVSRSGATIVGGLFMGLNRKEAAEFSFFLAVPTLTGAAFVKSLKLIHDIDQSQIIFLIAGTVLSFLFALAAIRFFIGLVSSYGFKFFGYYRIIVGVAVLIAASLN